MDLAHFVYVSASVVFVGVWTYVILYNTRMGSQIRRMEASGRKMNCKEEGIALVTLAKERAGRTGSL